VHSLVTIYELQFPLHYYCGIGELLSVVSAGKEN